MFIDQLVIGVLLVISTVMIHALALDRIMCVLEPVGRFFQRKFKMGWRAPILTFAVLGTFTSHVFQIWVWALFYLFVGAVANLEHALYFSTSAFTTVGFGDIVLDERWRLLSSFQAANGFILFGWSTAFIFEVMYKLYESTTFVNTKRK